MNVANIPRKEDLNIEPSLCSMCRVGLQTGYLNPWDIALVQSTSFVVVPSLGALVEGWLLIVPKRHVLSSAELAPGELQELESLKQAVGHVVARNYGEVSYFEHGPSVPNKSTGCSVDHAHVHVAPVTSSILDIAQSIVEHRFVTGSILDCQLALRKGLDYLYFENDGVIHIATATNFASQTFRKAVATILKCPEAYDWKSNHCLVNIDRTIARLSGDLALLD